MDKVFGCVVKLVYDNRKGDYVNLSRFRRFNRFDSVWFLFISKCMGIEINNFYLILVVL